MRHLLQQYIMWYRLAQFILKYKLPLLLILIGFTIWISFYARQAQMSYEFSKAVPTDNPKYQEYLAFKQKFGDDGNLLVVAIQTNKIRQAITCKLSISL